MGVTVIWVLLHFVVEVKVIIVTHGHPTPPGRETTPLGDNGGEKVALTVADNEKYTHRVHVSTHV